MKRKYLLVSLAFALLLPQFESRSILSKYEQPCVLSYFVQDSCDYTELIRHPIDCDKVGK